MQANKLLNDIRSVGRVLEYILVYNIIIYS